MGNPVKMGLDSEVICLSFRARWGTSVAALISGRETTSGVPAHNTVTVNDLVTVPTPSLTVTWTTKLPFTPLGALMVN